MQRSLFCSEIQRKYNENTTFIKHILFTDEVIFTRGGIFNTHNTHIWVIENSHSIIHQNFQKQFSVNVWLDILDNKLIGLQFLPPWLTGETCKISLLDEINLNKLRNAWLMHLSIFSNVRRIVNKKRVSTEIPRFKSVTFLYLKINLWSDILNNKLRGPHFFLPLNWRSICEISEKNWYFLMKN